MQALLDGESPKGGSEKGIRKTCLCLSDAKVTYCVVFVGSPFSTPPWGDGDFGQ